MPDIPLRNRSLRRLSFTLAIGGVMVGVMLLAAGAYLVMLPVPETLGVLVMTGGLMLALLPALLHVAVLLLLKAEANVNRVHHDGLDLSEMLKRMEPLIKTLAENSQISDAARSIAHREHERDALRQAIREEMYSGDWEAAAYFIDQMERRFGYMQEAKTLRAEINQVREMTIEEKINEAILHIETLMNEYQWDRARQESERMLKLFPRHERVMNLPVELNRRREARKTELLLKWKDAVNRNEIDAGIAILTELDSYITPTETQSLRDSARHVFKSRLLNLGVRFSLAASEGRWRDALEIGVQLRQEFPNSRMAEEVADKIDVLRVRAGFVSDAEVVQRRTTAAN